jgi:hypothetical protein
VSFTSNAKTLTSTASAPATTASGQRTSNASASIGTLSVAIKNGTSVLMTLNSTRLSSERAS